MGPREYRQRSSITLDMHLRLRSAASRNHLSFLVKCRKSVLFNKAAACIVRDAPSGECLNAKRPAWRRAEVACISASQILTDRRDLAEHISRFANIGKIPSRRWDMPERG